MNGPASTTTRISFLAALLAVMAALLAACSSAPRFGGAVVVLQARGAINPVMAGYLSRNIDTAQSGRAAAVVIQLDTPGGLDSSMRQIIQHMNASTVPVIVYVSPNGARAASAGTFITEAAAVAAMAPGTNIGAASPVSAGGADINGTEGKKVTNDAVAFIRSLAQEHGRNADWAENAVRQASALPASEARAQNVVDLIAADVPSLLNQADGRTVRVAGEDVVVQTQGRITVGREKTLAESILDIISDPNVAYLLITLGGLALAFEIIHPTIFTGAFGVILFVTGLFALGSLPTNWAGVALIMLAFALLVADVYAGGVGVLAAGGVTALVIGGLLLVGGSGATPEVSRWLVFGSAAVIGVLFAGGISALYRSRRKPSVVGELTLIGRQAIVRSALDPVGYVSIGGENWKARIGEGRADAGETVAIVAVRGLELDVRRASARTDPGEERPNQAPAAPAGPG